MPHRLERVVACLRLGVADAEYEGEDVVVDDVEQPRYQQLAAEGQHAPDGGFGEAERRTPGGVVPAQEDAHGSLHDHLDYEAPVGHAAECHRHRNDARHDERREVGAGLLLHHQPLDEDGVVHRPRTAEEEPQEEHPGACRQFGRAIELGNPRCGKEEEDVQPRPHRAAEPEDGVIVFVGSILLVDECRGEAAVLKQVGQGRKDEQHAEQSVVVRREDACQHDAEEHARHLLERIAESAPEESFCRLVFE